MRVLRNAGWLVAGRAGADALGLVFFLALARRFGEAGLGDFSFAFALAAVAGLVVSFGLDAYLVREVARAPDRPLVAPALRLQAALAAVAAAGLAAATLLAGWGPSLRWLVALAFIHVALLALGRTFVAHLQARERMAESAALDVLARAALVLVGLALLAAGASLPVVSSAYVAGGLVYLGLARVRFARAFVGTSARAAPPPAGALLRGALVFAMGLALYELYARADLILLHFLRGEVETGRYAAAWKLVTVPLFVPSLLGLSIYPLLSREGGDRTPGIRVAYALFVKWMTLLGGTGAVLLLVAGDGAFGFLFGTGFSEAAPLVRWMAPLFFVEFAKVPFWRLLFATDRERTVLAAQAGAVALNVVLNLLLIPRHGALGAVWASLISQGLEYPVLVGLAGRQLPGGLRAIAAPVAVLLGLAAAAGLALRPLFPWWVLAPALAAAVLAAAALTGIARPRELRELRAGGPTIDDVFPAGRDA